MPFASLTDELFEVILESVSTGIIVTDCQNVIIFYNTPARRLLNIRRHAIGEVLHVLLPEINLSDISRQGITLLPYKDTSIRISRVSVSDGTSPIGCVLQIFGGTDREKLNAHFAEVRMAPKTSSKARVPEGDLISHELITQNKKMHMLLDLAWRVAKSDVTILLQGESGVGKEVFAKLIHFWSNRTGVFIKVNCGALPWHLLESELFGYAKGAFTGANPEGKPGFFKLADGGTLFLDEIEDLPLELQGKFLRVLQDQEFIRVGGTKVIKVDVRLIAAGNKNLTLMTEDNKFRRDLYYRLNVIPIDIPPLRERPEDISLLVDYFLKKMNRKYGANKSILPHLVETFTHCEWLGNVRELRNAIERLVLTSEEDVISSLAPTGGPGAPHMMVVEPGGSKTDNIVVDLKSVRETAEKEALSKALERYGNSRRMGEALGISHTSVLNKLKKYGLG